MPRKRKMPKQTAPPNERAFDFKEEQPDKPKGHLRDIKNVVMENRDLFGSNIYNKDVLLAMQNEIQESACNCTSAPISTTKANAVSNRTSAPISTTEANAVSEQCPDDDNDCVVLSQGSTPRSSPRKRCRRRGKSATADEMIVTPSEETQEMVKKLEMLESIGCEEYLSDDSSDSVVCLDKCPSLPVDKEDDELVFMVHCQSRILRYSIAPHTPFAEILEKLAHEYSVGISQVMLLAKEQPVQPEDTPQSLALSAVDILECIVRKYGGEPSSKAKKMITLKFQCANKRSTENIQTALDEPLQVGARVFAQKLGLPFSKLVYKFDGEKVDLRSTPEDLGIEDGDCVDVSVRS